MQKLNPFGLFGPSRPKGASDSERSINARRHEGLEFVEITQRCCMRIAFLMLPYKFNR